MEAMKSDGSFQDGCVHEIVHGDAFTAFKIPSTEYDSTPYMMGPALVRYDIGITYSLRQKSRH